MHSCLLCAYMNLEYVRSHGIHRVNRATYVIRILVVAPQEYVNIYLTVRVDPNLLLTRAGAGGQAMTLKHNPVTEGTTPRRTTLPC